MGTELTVKQPRKHTGGSPEFEFTSEILDTIDKLTRIGTPVEDVAWMIGCNKKTIERHLKDENDPVSVAISNGRINKKLFLRKNAFRMAKQNPGMAIFLCKTQLGWSEKVDINVTGKVEHKAVTEFSDEELLKTIESEKE